MTLGRHFIFAALMGISAPLAADATQDSVNEIRGSANKAISNFGGISRHTIPGFEGVPADANSLYGDGLAFPTDQGASKMTECSTNATGNTRQNIECSAMNFYRSADDQRPPVDLNGDDPILSTQKEVLKNPMPLLERNQYALPSRGTNGQYGQLPSSVCNPTTVSVPERAYERACTQYFGSSQYNCEQSLQVTVKPEFNYACKTATKKRTEPTCTKSLIVQAYQSCDEGTWSLENTVQRNELDYMKIKFRCDWVRPDNMLNLNVYAYGQKGAQGEWLSPKIPDDMSTLPAPVGAAPNSNRYPQFDASGRGYWEWLPEPVNKWAHYLVTSQPHWEGAIREIPVYLLAESPGCKGDSCDYRFVFVWWSQSYEMGSDGNWTGANTGIREAHVLYASNVKPRKTITESFDDQCTALEGRL